MELSEYTLKTLRKDGEFILYRGQHQRPAHASPPTILVVTPVLERPAIGSIKRMEHEYSLRAEIDPEWGIRPFALALHWQTPPLDQLKIFGRTSGEAGR